MKLRIRVQLLGWFLALPVAVALGTTPGIGWRPWGFTALAFGGFVVVAGGFLGDRR